MSRPWSGSPAKCLPSVPGAHFVIAGRSPAPAVQALAGERVTVTGGVADMRSWLAAADVVVAPLLIARGVQNKVLEAMAMARPVVASPAAYEGIEAEPGRHLVVADGAETMAAAIRGLLDDRAQAARLGAEAGHWCATPTAGTPVSRRWTTFSRHPGGGRDPCRRSRYGQPQFPPDPGLGRDDECGMSAGIAPNHLILRRDAPDDAWRQQATLLAVAASAILLLFWHDFYAMASIWWNASTYNHCLLIPPLIAWLVWQRRAELAELTPTSWRPGLALAAAGAIAWLLGYAGGISLGRHLGLILMLQGAILTLLGKAVARGLAFPIFYLLFLVPFGDEVLPFMQTLTAKLAMMLLNVGGTPAHLQGVFITTPSGYFEVAEACAGVKFLVAMVALGALVANLCFRSWTRRVAFMIASVTVPVLANGVRAWGTIYVAEGTSVDYASAASTMSSTAGSSSPL